MPRWLSSATKGIEMAGAQRLAKTDRRETKKKRNSERGKVSSRISLRLTKKTCARNKKKKLTKDAKDSSSLCFNIYKEEPQRLPRIESRPGLWGRRELKLRGGMDPDSRLWIGGFGAHQSPHKHRPRAWWWRSPFVTIITDYTAGCSGGRALSRFHTEYGVHDIDLRSRSSKFEVLEPSPRVPKLRLQSMRLQSR